MAKIFLVCMLAISGLMSSLADEEINEGQMNVRVLGQSGEISMKNKNGNLASVTFHYIKELTADDKPVDETRETGKHEIRSFENQQFQCETTGLPTEYQNIGVQSMKCITTIPGPEAILTVDIYIFKAAGEISTAKDEVLNVKKGTVKFDISIKHWPFCGGSDGVECRVGSSLHEGKYLELCLKIKGRGKAKEKKQTSGKGQRQGLKTFDIGVGLTTTSGKVKKDDEWQSLNDLTVDKHDGVTHLKFKFPRFTKELFYDPTFDMSTAPGGGAALAKGQMALISLCALLVMVKLIA